MKKMKKSFLMRFSLLIAVFIGFLGLIQCTNVLKRAFPISHNSANSLDWQGTYKNAMPETNYSGTITELTLDTAQTFILKRMYFNKGVQPEKGTERRGNFSWNRAGNTITLLGIENQPHEFFVGENRLWELDRKGHKITGNDADKFILNKLENAVTMPKTPTLTGSWELDYIAGSTLIFQELYPRKRPTIIFDTLNYLVSGSTSCNNYVGKLIMNDHKIDFSGPLKVTKMACLDSSGNGENLFLETLKNVNNYSLNPDSTLNFIMGDIATMRFSKK
jgi:heat shock protein HslJ